MKTLAKYIAIILVLVMLTSNAAFADNSVNNSNSDNSEWVLSKEELAKVYDEKNYENEFEPGEIIVGMTYSTREAYTEEEVRGLFSTISIAEIESFVDAKEEQERPEKIQMVYHITLSQKTESSVIDAIEVLKHIKKVSYVQPNYIYYPARTPNEPQYGSLWGMGKIGAPSAWNITTGSSDVKVAILDSGVDHTHPDLIDNLDMSLAYNVIDNTNNVLDYAGHGTHVAGIIGGIGNNGIGIAGVSWRVKMIPIKVARSDNTTTTTILKEAIKHVIKHNIPIANLSYLIPSYDLTFINTVKDYAGLLVIAAGNSGGLLNSNQSYMELHPLSNVIVVANSQVDDSKHTDSNFGFFTVTLAAPGTDIYSTLPTYFGTGGYGYMTGTSMAAGHVAGAAALLLSIAPNLTAQSMKSLIVNNVDIVPALSFMVSTGGRLNVYKALQDLQILFPKHTVHGYVYPMAIYNLFPGFQKKHDILVELRQTFKTPATGNLSTYANLNSSLNWDGDFTLSNVPIGCYVLYIKRPGYLTRAMNITVLSTDPSSVEVAPPGAWDDGVFNLWWGDCNFDNKVTSDDTQLVLDQMSIGSNANHPNYNPACDLNADGSVDNGDIMLVLNTMNCTIDMYAGTNGVDFLS